MLPTECSVCGCRRKFRNLTYDQQLNPYCKIPSQCHRDHPNSMVNCQKRGTFVHLMTYEEASSFHMDRAGDSYRAVAKASGNTAPKANFARLSRGSISFRTKSEQQAEYIVYRMAKIGTAEISTAVADIIQRALTSDPEFLAHSAGKQVAVSQIPTPTSPFIVEPKKMSLEVHPPSLKTRTLEADEGEFML